MKRYMPSLSVIVILRPEPEVSLRVLAHAYGAGQVLRLDPAALRTPGLVSV